MLLKVHIPEKLFNDFLKHTKKPGKKTRELIVQYVEQQQREGEKTKKDITDFTRNESGYLLHTISVECSYHEFKHAREHDAISFIARTDGEWEGEEVKDLDYAIECSIGDAREFAEYILSLCNEIELAQIPKKENK